MIRKKAAANYFRTSFVHTIYQYTTVALLSQVRYVLAHYIGKSEKGKNKTDIGERGGGEQKEKIRKEIKNKDGNCH
jgi:hypothetical protein